MDSIKNNLKRRKLSVGSWIALGHSSIPEIMVSHGFEWLTIDMEHSAITLDVAQLLIQSVESVGCIPLVRVGENDATLIKRVMDAGAHGVIVPMVNSKEDAERAVCAVHYPPAGTRGVGLARAQGYGFRFDEYKKWLCSEVIVIAQIEHIEAIDNLEEILSVKGIDGTIIGPYDLSGSLGYPGEFKRKEVKQAITRYESVCKKLRKPMGYHVVQPDARSAQEYIKRGYTFLAVGVDFLYMGCKCDEVMTKILKNR